MNLKSKTRQLKELPINDKKPHLFQCKTQIKNFIQQTMTKLVLIILN